jgi:hypothetical protein
LHFWHQNKLIYVVIIHISFFLVNAIKAPPSCWKTGKRMKYLAKQWKLGLIRQAGCTRNLFSGKEWQELCPSF